MLDKNDGQWIPLSKTEHANLALKLPENFKFARTINLVRLSFWDLLNSVSAIPILFKRVEEKIFLVGFLGLETGQNLYLGKDGKWLGRYVPLALQSYPFKLLKLSNGKHVVLIKKDHLVSETEGVRLFLDNGAESNLLKSRLELLKKIESGKTYTDRACQLINKLDLLKKYPISYSVKTKKKNMSGLLSIDEEQFRQLTAVHLNQLQKNRALDMIFAHFYSLTNFSILQKQFSIVSNETTELQKIGREIFEYEQMKEFNFDWSG
ncbi:MAG: hypothetical protein CBC24_07620 [Candidatus Pelagibacter sp. TMED64]|nr:MAG: hypothetical protein CBC24_07620 [Candidatus Pelagibacter sp. TMED64]|tara:strand:+ start:355 stop:1146 length:792 start_codon:yes stop_codon:yes gene_type:complete